MVIRYPEHRDGEMEERWRERERRPSEVSGPKAVSCGKHGEREAKVTELPDGVGLGAQEPSSPEASVLGSSMGLPSVMATEPLLKAPSHAPPLSRSRLLDGLQV